MLALALEAEPPGPLEDGEEGKDREQTPGAGAQRRKRAPPKGCSADRNHQTRGFL